MADAPQVLGQLPDDQADRLLRQTGFFRQAELKWDEDLVKLRIEECARGVERLVGHIGPSRKSGFWPEMTVEFADQVAMLGTKELDAFYRSKNRAGRGGLSDRDISRIEEANRWPITYLQDHEDERMALWIWTWCKARNQRFSEHYRQVCTHRSTALRRRDRAIRIILEGLIRDGVLP